TTDGRTAETRACPLIVPTASRASLARRGAHAAEIRTGRERLSAPCRWIDVTPDAQYSTAARVACTVSRSVRRIWPPRLPATAARLASPDLRDERSADSLRPLQSG